MRGCTPEISVQQAGGLRDRFAIEVGRFTYFALPFPEDSMKKKKPLLPVGAFYFILPPCVPSTSGEMLTGSSPLRGARAMDQSNDQIVHGRQDVWSVGLLLCARWREGQNRVR